MADNSVDHPDVDQPAFETPAPAKSGLARADGMAPLDALLADGTDPLFWRPTRLGVDSAWYGHIPFAHWVVAAARPRSLVELGSHAGVSYSAFCEAVLRARLDTRCFAVDTWRGDEHAGFYGEDIYQDLASFHDARYGAFSQLLRCTFDEALPYVPDGSVDLLHIDGRHAYEDVRHDFDSWLPKLSARAVVLFHDTNVRERGFGVWRLWAELTATRPHFEFLHEHGLGVLVVGTDPPAALAGLCGLTDALDIGRVRERFAQLGERWTVDMSQRRTRLEAATLREHNTRLETAFHQIEAYSRALGGGHHPPSPDTAAARAREARLATARAVTLEAELRLAHRRAGMLEAAAVVAEQAAQVSIAEVRQHARNLEAHAAGVEADAARRLAEMDENMRAGRQHASGMERRGEDADAQPALEHEIVSLREEVARLTHLAAARLHEQNILVSSTAWRLTRPMRNAARLLGVARQRAIVAAPASPAWAAPDDPAPEIASPATEVPAATFPAAEAHEAEAGEAGDNAAGMSATGPSFQTSIAEPDAPVPAVAQADVDAIEPPPPTIWLHPRVTATGRTPRVLFASGEPGTPGEQYRCVRYADAARDAGWVAATKWSELITGEDLVGLDLLVLWRTHMTPQVERLIAAMRHHGGRVALDLDDVMHRPELARIGIIDGIRTVHSNEGSTRGLFQSVRQVLDSVDFAIATTEELADGMRKWQQAAYVLPNGFDDASLRAARLAVRRRAVTQATPDPVVRLGYASGSRTHQKDFAVIVEPLAAVLRARPQARLVLFRSGADGIGLLMPDEFPALDDVLGQIEWREMVPLCDLPGELARFDVNLVPLEVGNPFVEAKSELKYFEAALAGVCSVASPTGPYRRAIADGVTGLLASDADAWRERLLRLIDDPALRARMARDAYHDVLWRFGPARRVDLLRSFLAQHRLEAQASLAAEAARAYAYELHRPPVTLDLPELRATETLFHHDQMGQAEVTVVIPVYNYADYILEALESARIQTLASLDLVVVDDCSTDPASTDLVLDWAQTHCGRFNRLVVLRHVANAGLAHSRNAAFAAAETPYVLPLDADNRLRPEAAETLLAAITASGAAFAYPRLQRFEGQADVFGGNRFEPHMLVGGNSIDAMALIAKWAWAAAGGYFDHPDALGWEDYRLWCRLIELGCFGHPVAEVLGDYRVHATSMLDSKTEQAANKARLVSLMEARHPWLRIISRAALVREIAPAQP